jgi:hypothetical protein
LHAITSWPDLRLSRLSNDEFECLGRLLAGTEPDHGGHGSVQRSLRDRAIILDHELEGYADLARAGWHGSIPGWLGSPELARSAPQALASAPLLAPSTLKEAFESRRSTHAFSGWRADPDELATVLRLVRPADREIEMHLVLIDGGYRVFQWTGTCFEPSRSGPESDLSAMRARTGLTSPSGYLVFTTPDNGYDLSVALIALGRIAQRAILALTARTIASCPVHLDDDASVHALLGLNARFDPAYVVAFGKPAGAL